MGFHPSAEDLVGGSREDGVPLDLLERDRWISLCIERCMWAVDLVQYGQVDMLGGSIVLKGRLSGAEPTENSCSGWVWDFADLGGRTGFDSWN